MAAHFGAIGELMCCEVDFAKGPFPYETPECVVAHGSKVLRRELPVRACEPSAELWMVAIAYCRSSL